MSSHLVTGLTIDEEDQTMFCGSQSGDVLHVDLASKVRVRVRVRGRVRGRVTLTVTLTLTLTLTRTSSRSGPRSASTRA